MPARCDLGPARRLRLGRPRRELPGEPGPHRRVERLEHLVTVTQATDSLPAPVAVRTSEPPRLVAAGGPEPRVRASVDEYRRVQRRLAKAAEEVLVEELELDAVCRGEK